MPRTRTAAVLLALALAATAGCSAGGPTLEDRVNAESELRSRPSLEATLARYEQMQQSIRERLDTALGPFPWEEIQPYLRVDAGLLLSQQSSIRMRATYERPASPDSVVDYFVYQDDHPASIKPALALGAGLTAFVSRSYQVRLEAKDNLVWLEQVAGTVPFPNMTPPTTTGIHHVFILTIAVEVVLEKKRGRRY